MSRPTRGDGTTNQTSLASSNSQARRTRTTTGKNRFPCSADHEQDRQSYSVDPYSAIISYGHTIYGSSSCGHTRTGVRAHYFFYFFFFFFNLTYSRWTSSLPSCLWSQRIFPSLPGSRLTIFLSRCKFSTLTTRQPIMVEQLMTEEPRQVSKRGTQCHALASYFLV